MRALLIVDLQNDFMPGGALPVPDGREVVPVANHVQPAFDLVVASQDWHPPDHGSFASNHEGARPYELGELDGLEQVYWPDHCVQGTRGAEFVDGLELARVDRVFRKGTDPRVDSYSAFFDNGRRRSTGLDDYLRERAVRGLAVLGVATDYCVKFSVLDACAAGFDTSVVLDGCRGVALAEGDVERALDEMRTAGARLVNSASLDA